MDQITGQWASTFMEHQGNLELVVIFQTKDENEVVISFRDLQAVVGHLQNEMGKKGALGLFPIDLQVQN